MNAAYRIAIGTRVWFEDEQHDVVGFTDTATRLRSESGGMQLVATGALLADPSFRRCTADDGGAARPVASIDTAAMLAALPAAERDRVTRLQAHLLELTTSESLPTMPDPDARRLEWIMGRIGSDNRYVILERADGWFVQVGYGDLAGVPARPRRPGHRVVRLRGKAG